MSAAAPPSKAIAEPLDRSFTLGNGLSIALRDWGPVASAVSGGSPARHKVLCLHGALDNAGTFERVLPPLIARTRGAYHFVCMDFAGHGLSAHRSRDAFYMRQAHVLDALEVAHRLGWATHIPAPDAPAAGDAKADAAATTPFAVMGHSLGAQVAVLMAGAAPQRIRTVIAIDGIAPLPSFEPAVALLGQYFDDYVRPSASASASGSAAGATPRRAKVHASFDAIVTRYREAGFLISADSAQHIVRRGSRAVTGGFVFAHDTRLTGAAGARSPVWLTATEIDDSLQAVTCPVMCLMAANAERRDALEEHDKGRAAHVAALPATATAAARAAAAAAYDTHVASQGNWIPALYGYIQRFRNATLTTVAADGHHIHLDHADECAAHIGHWLADHMPPAAPATRPATGAGVVLRSKL